MFILNEIKRKPPLQGLVKFLCAKRRQASKQTLTRPRHSAALRLRASACARTRVVALLQDLICYGRLCFQLSMICSSCQSAESCQSLLMTQRNTLRPILVNTIALAGEPTQAGSARMQRSARVNGLCIDIITRRRD